MSEKALKETYNDTILSYITDKVANVRYKTMLVLKNNSKLSNPTIEKHL